MLWSRSMLRRARNVRIVAVFVWPFDGRPKPVDSLDFIVVASLDQLKFEHS